MQDKYSLPESDQSVVVNEPSLAYSVQSKHTSPLSAYQMQILDSIANVRDENELKEIRNLIAEYFSNKALDAMDKLCEDGKLSTETIESWQSEHLRTPYNI